MTDTRIASRYARAVFILGQTEGKDTLTARGKTLKALDELVEANPALEGVFKSPIITVEEKKKILSDLLKKIGSDSVTSNFCYLLADKGRLPYFRAIVSAYTQLLDEANGVIRGKLTTAITLSGKKQEKIKADLVKKNQNRDIELTFDTDPSILGGVVLKVGDRVLDASLRAQLEMLRETFKRGN